MIIFNFIPFLPILWFKGIFNFYHFSSFEG